MSFKRVKAPGAGVYYTDIPDEKQDFHWRILHGIVCEKFPEYKVSFGRIMSSEFYSPCNMFIAKKQIFDDYSNWLFTVLNSYDDKLEQMGIERIPRVDGFLSECLLNIYFLHNFSEDRIHRADVMNFELGKGYNYPLFIRKRYNLLKTAERIKAVLKYIRNLKKYKDYKKSMR